MRQVMIIPDRAHIAECLRLAEEYRLGFEYNDFFLPNVLDDKEKLEGIVAEYKQHKLPPYATVHGDFFDVIPFSVDAKVREISNLRIRQSIDVARRMNVSAVVFHTNYNPFLNTKEYVEGWICQNLSYWSGVLEANKDVHIYLENMFDTSPDLLKELAGGLQQYSNFGLCLDYAHAALSKVEPQEWAKQLGKYVKHVHINDNDGISDLHLAWGDGTLSHKNFYTSYEKYMEGATVLVETSSMENKVRSLEVLEKEGFLEK